MAKYTEKDIIWTKKNYINVKCRLDKLIEKEGFSGNQWDLSEDTLKHLFQCRSVTIRTAYYRRDTSYLYLDIDVEFNDNILVAEFRYASGGINKNLLPNATINTVGSYTNENFFRAGGVYIYLEIDWPSDFGFYNFNRNSSVIPGDKKYYKYYKYKNNNVVFYKKYNKESIEELLEKIPTTAESKSIALLIHPEFMLQADQTIWLLQDERYATDNSQPISLEDTRQSNSPGRIYDHSISGFRINNKNMHTYSTWDTYNSWEEHFKTTQDEFLNYRSTTTQTPLEFSHIWRPTFFLGTNWQGEDLQVTIQVLDNLVKVVSDNVIEYYPFESLSHIELIKRNVIAPEIQAYMQYWRCAFHNSTPVTFTHKNNSQLEAELIQFLKDSIYAQKGISNVECYGWEKLEGSKDSRLGFARCRGRVTYSNKKDTNFIDWMFGQDHQSYPIEEFIAYFRSEGRTIAYIYIDGTKLTGLQRCTPTRFTHGGWVLDYPNSHVPGALYTPDKNNEGLILNLADIGQLSKPVFTGTATCDYHKKTYSLIDYPNISIDQEGISAGSWKKWSSVTDWKTFNSWFLELYCENQTLEVDLPRIKYMDHAEGVYGEVRLRDTSYTSEYSSLRTLAVGIETKLVVNDVLVFKHHKLNTNFNIYAKVEDGYQPNESDYDKGYKPTYANGGINWMWKHTGDAYTSSFAFLKVQMQYLAKWPGILPSFIYLHKPAEDSVSGGGRWATATNPNPNSDGTYSSWDLYRPAWYDGAYKYYYSFWYAFTNAEKPAISVFGGIPDEIGNLEYPSDF